MSDDRKEQPVEYIFRAKTKEAFVIKILGELLANTIRFSPIKINEKGITLTQADANTEILVDIMLQKRISVVSNVLNH